MLLCNSPDVLQLTRNNGSAAVYTRRVSPRKVFVKNSQAVAVQSTTTLVRRLAEVTS